MNRLILTLLSSFTLTISALAHGEVELGPNGGRVLEFSKNESLHGEVTLKDGKFQIALFDHEMKPVTLAEQELTATSGDRAKPEKLAVEKSGNRFVVPAVKEGDWVIFQYRESAGARPVTARLHYDTKTCSACKAPEWLCECDRRADAGK